MVVDTVDYLEDMLWWREGLEEGLEVVQEVTETVIMLKDIWNYIRNIWEYIIDIEIIKKEEHMQIEYYK